MTLPFVFPKVIHPFEKRIPINYKYKVKIHKDFLCFLKNPNLEEDLTISFYDNKNIIHREPIKLFRRNNKCYFLPFEYVAPQAMRITKVAINLNWFDVVEFNLNKPLWYAILLRKGESFTMDKISFRI